MLFIDASVIVAILQRENDAQELYDRLIDDGGPYRVSPIVRMEASLALALEMAAKHRSNTPATPEMMEQARLGVDAFIEAIGATDVTITSTIGVKAQEAATRFGKIVGHPAKLNMGDCYAYACAQAGAPAWPIKAMISRIPIWAGRASRVLKPRRGADRGKGRGARSTGFQGRARLSRPVDGDRHGLGPRPLPACST